MSEKPIGSGAREAALSERQAARALFLRRLVLAELLARPGQGPLATRFVPRRRTEALARPAEVEESEP